MNTPTLSHGRRVFLSLCCVTWLAASGSAQQPPAEGADPRSGEDPRTGTDPRSGADPREAVTDPYAALKGPELYDALFAAGDDTRLGAALRTDQWSILGYIDGHCERWLALVERGQAEQEAGRLKMAAEPAKGRKLAQLADLALGDSRYTAYVEAFFVWTPEQQKEFRAGQASYREGMTRLQAVATPQEALVAIGPVRNSLEIARKLGDTWGQTMSLSIIGRVEADTGQEATARATMALAVKLGREIRDADAVWEGFSVTYESAVRSRQWPVAKEALRGQYLMAEDMRDEQTAQKILQQLLELEQLSQKG